MLAAWYTDSFEFQQALKAADRAITVNFDMPMIHLIHSTCRNGLGQHEQALECADRYAELLGADADTLRTLIDIHRRVMPDDEMIQVYEEELKGLY